MNREFVDGVLDVVTADRSSQFAFVMGPPSLFRGSVQSSNNNNNNNSQDNSFFGSTSNINDNNNNNTNRNDSASNQNSNNNNSTSVSNALLHASLLSGVVESHHKMAQQSNAAADTGLIRPPHWPRLIRTGGVPLGRAAIAPTCPPVSRQIAAPAPNALTKLQINTSKALNEGCVALSSNSQHSWLHPSVAPCSTEPVAEWILSHEPHHQESQNELLRERMMTTGGKFQLAHVGVRDHAQNDNQRSMEDDSSSSSHRHPHEHDIPSMFYFPWRIFGDSLGIVYCIFAAGPLVATMKMTNSNESLQKQTQNIDGQNQTEKSSSPNGNKNTNNNNHTSLGRNSGGSTNDLLSLNQSAGAAGGNHFANQSFAGFFGPSSFVANTHNNNTVPSASSSSSSPPQRKSQNQNNRTVSSDGRQPLLESYIHEENMPAVKQSMANLFVLLCDAFKMTKSVEAPGSKMLISNLDQVHECVEICCPGNGRCMPVFDTAMARKLWKMRNEI